MADDTIRLKVESDSTPVERARKKVAEYRAELSDLQDAFDRGAVHGAQFRQESARLEAQISKAEKSLGKIAESSHAVTTAQEGVARGGKGVGQAMLMVSQTMDDAQYGIQGVVNNVPSLLGALGAGAGLAGVAQVAMIGVNYLVEHLDDLERALGIESADAFVARMQQVAESADKAAKQVKLATDAIAHMRTPDEHQAGGATRDALLATGQMPAIRDAVLDTLTHDRMAGDNAYQETDAKLQEIQARRHALWQTILADPVNVKDGKATQRAYNLFTLWDRKDAADLRTVGAQHTKRAGELRGLADADAATLFQDAFAGDPKAKEKLAGLLDRAGRADLAETVRTGANQKARDRRKAEDEQREADIQAEVAGGKIAEKDEIARQAEKRRQEADRDRQGAARDDDARVRKLTDRLQGQFNDETLSGRNVTAANIEDRLVKSQGLTPADAREVSGSVRQGLRDGFQDRVRKHAGETGLSYDEAIADLKGRRLDQQQAYQMQLVEARMGLAARGMAADRDLFKAPERIAAQDFARKVEAGGGVQQDILQTLQQNLAMQREWDRYIKLLGNPPKLGR